jgi:polysaccharide biosynthesis transport protein
VNQEYKAPLPQDQELTLRDILNVVFRHKWKIIAFFLCTVSLVTAAAFLWPKTYESTAQVMIRLGRENATLDPTAAGAALTIGGEARENEINSEMEVIKSRELAEKVLQVMGIDRILNRKPEKYAGKVFTQLDSLKLREQAVQAMSKSLTTEVVKKTNVITIAYQSYDPKIAQEVVNRLIGFYREKHEAIYRPSGSYGFFEKQTDTLGEALTAGEAGLRNLKNTTGIASIEAQQVNLISRISALRLELEQVNADYAASKAKIETMQKTANDLPRIINTSAEREIQMNLFSEQSNFSALSAKAKSVSAALDSARGELVKFNDDALAISRLQRQRDINELNYRKYADNLEQSRIDHDLQLGNLSNIAIVQPATFVIKPVKPKKPYILMLGMFLGVFGGLCIAFVLEFLDHTFKTGEEIESFLRLPVLGVVPFIKKKTKKDDGASMLNGTDPFDAVRRGLLSGANGAHKPPRNIGIMGCYHGEGASTVAANMSKAIAAHYDARVLLVDLNFEAPSLKRRLGLPYTSDDNGKRLSTIPAPDAVGVFQVSADVAPGVDVLPAGFNNLNPMKLSQSDHFTGLLTEHKEKYDYVVFDLPPIAQSLMAIEFAPFFDGVILVVEAGRVRRQVVRQAVTKMSRAGVTIFGVVLNKRKYYVPQWAYGRL